jgi:hypothetical protein
MARLKDTECDILRVTAKEGCQAYADWAFLCDLRQHSPTVKNYFRIFCGWSHEYS